MSKTDHLRGMVLEEEAWQILEAPVEKVLLWRILPSSEMPARVSVVGAQDFA